MRKRCSKCGHIRKFNKNQARSTGRDSWCAICMNNYHKKYYKENPKKRRDRKKQFEKTHPTYMRDYQLRTKYGLTEKDFQVILKFQENCCALCRTATPGGRYSWHIDHDHIQNVVRGILCSNCNLALGHYEKIAEKVLSYLNNPPAVVALKRSI